MNPFCAKTLKQTIMRCHIVTMALRGLTTYSHWCSLSDLPKVTPLPPWEIEPSTSWSCDQEINTLPTGPQWLHQYAFLPTLYNFFQSSAIMTLLTVVGVVIIIIDIYEQWASWGGPWRGVRPAARGPCSQAATRAVMWTMSGVTVFQAQDFKQLNYNCTQWLGWNKNTVIILRTIWTTCCHYSPL